MLADLEGKMKTEIFLLFEEKLFPLSGARISFVSELEEPSFEFSFNAATVVDEFGLFGKAKIAHFSFALFVAYEKNSTAFAKISHSFGFNSRGLWGKSSDKNSVLETEYYHNTQKCKGFY